jgi:hypothetical protein
MRHRFIKPMIPKSLDIPNDTKKCILVIVGQMVTREQAKKQDFKQKNTN